MQLDLVWKDIVVAARNTRRRPGFALLVAATLAVGLGVNAAIFALVDAVLLRPLPYRAPDRLAFVWQTLPQHNVFDVEATPADYTAWHQLASFSGLAMIAADTHAIAGDHEPERVRGARVTASLMPLLGITPARGRAFVDAEDVSGAAPVAILSDALWRRRYGADPGIVGRTIRIDGVPHEVVGIMPASAILPGALAGNGDLWLPMRMTPDERTNHISHTYTVVGRLADGVTVTQASSELARYPTATAFLDRRPDAAMGARAVSVADATVRQIRPALGALLLGVIALLLAATANVATLVLSRALAGAHEVAIRTALGASRARLVRATTIETVGLALLGAAGGVVTGSATLTLLLPLFQGSLPQAIAEPHVGVRVAAVTFGLAVLLGILFGRIAVRRSGREARLAVDLRAGDRTSPARTAVLARTVLVVAQVAFAVVLLAVAGLLVRSVVRLSKVSPGFAADHLLTFRLALDSGPYASPSRRDAFASGLIRELGSRPGIASAALVSRIPLGGSRGASPVDIEGRVAAPGEVPIIDQRHITPEYFRTMRIPLLAGRPFADTDTATGEPIAIVNRTMADRYWPGGTPLDHRVRVTAGFDSGRWIRIVGVVDNVHHVGLASAPVPEMYRPYAQAPPTEFSVVVRTTGEPGPSTAVCRGAVQSLDRNLPVFDLRTMDDRLAASMAEQRATAILLAATALLGALLAVIAIYGSNWHAVAQRIPEIGIRLALGATRRRIYLGVVAAALGRTAVGALAGGVVVGLARPLFSTLLFDTAAADPQTMGGVAFVVAALTIAGTVGPAARAIRVDPAAALRNE